MSAFKSSSLQDVRYKRDAIESLIFIQVRASRERQENCFQVRRVKPEQRKESFLKLPTHVFVVLSHCGYKAAKQRNKNTLFSECKDVSTHQTKIYYTTA